MNVLTLIVMVVVLFFSPVVRGEVIDRIMAVLPGQMITLSDVEAALDLGLVEARPGEDRLAAGLTGLVDRMLMLGEVRRVAPADPAPAAVEARVAVMRQRFPSDGAMKTMLAARGVSEAVLRVYAADDLRLAAYLNERFSAAAQPTDEELQQAGGEPARARLTAERRQSLIAAWVAELRRRTEIRQ